MAAEPQAPAAAPAVAPTNWLKVAIAWLISLAFIFFVIYVISRAWKTGQKAA